VTPAELQRIFEALDVDRNQSVDWIEWLSATLPADVVQSAASRRELFNFLDRDGDAKVSKRELSSIAGCEEVERICEEGLLDYDGDDADLDFESFSRLVSSRADRVAWAPVVQRRISVTTPLFASAAAS